jgi:hypothetical protein
MKKMLWIFQNLIVHTIRYSPTITDKNSISIYKFFLSKSINEKGEKYLIKDIDL